MMDSGEENAQAVALDASESSEMSELSDVLQVMISKLAEAKANGCLPPEILKSLASIVSDDETSNGLEKAASSSTHTKEVVITGKKEESSADLNDFVVIDEVEDDAENTARDERDDEDQDVEKGVWSWKRTFRAVDRSLELELPGVNRFMRLPFGQDRHPKAHEPKYKQLFEEMRKNCHGYFTNKSGPMKAAINWYNRTVREPNLRLSVLNDRMRTFNVKRSRLVQESDLALGPALFSLLHPFVWHEEGQCSLGIRKNLPAEVVQEWDRRGDELKALETISLHIRRGAQTQALIFEELLRILSDAEDNVRVGELRKKLQPACDDLADLMYYMCNRATALFGLTSKSSRRIVVDAMGIDQAEVTSILYGRLGYPLFTVDEAKILMDLSPHSRRNRNFTGRKGYERSEGRRRTRSRSPLFYRRNQRQY